jgi:hypothetical protein
MFMIALNIVTAMLAIASAFCWFRSAVAPSTQEGRWQKLTRRIDKWLESTPGTTWNWLAAILTGFAALGQGIAAIVSAFNS